MCCIGDAGQRIMLPIGSVFHLTKSVAVDRELPSRVAHGRVCVSRCGEDLQ